MQSLLFTGCLSPLQTALFYHRQSWESLRSNAKKGPVVGPEEPGCGWIRCVCRPVLSNIAHYNDVTMNVIESKIIYLPPDCLLKRLFRLTSKKTYTPALLVLCEDISPVTGEFPTQRACNTETVSMSWRHNETWRKSEFGPVTDIRQLSLTGKPLDVYH